MKEQEILIIFFFKVHERIGKKEGGLGQRRRDVPVPIPGDLGSLLCSFFKAEGDKK